MPIALGLIVIAIGILVLVSKGPTIGAIGGIVIGGITVLWWLMSEGSAAYKETPQGKLDDREESLKLREREMQLAERERALKERESALRDKR